MDKLDVRSGLAKMNMMARGLPCVLSSGISSAFHGFMGSGWQYMDLGGHVYDDAFYFNFFCCVAGNVMALRKD